MNRREARRRVLQTVAYEILGDLDSGAEWISMGEEHELLPDADIDRMETAVRELAEQLLAKAARLEDPS